VSDASITTVLVATAIPVVCATVGATIAAYRPPGAWVRSATQHVAAGLVFGAAATELVPDLLRDHARRPVVIGFILGIAVMLAVSYVLPRLSGDPDSPTAMLVAVGVDVFIDGLLIGIGFAEGGKVGLILTVALTVELTFLGLAVSAALSEQGASRTKLVATTFGLSLLVIVGGRSPRSRCCISSPRSCSPRRTRPRTPRCSPRCSSWDSWRFCCWP
jgi:ZIP family zinc transporter